jgi:quercetin dioxygenase-like cupin family protein
MGGYVIGENEREFYPVEWGLTKNIFGTENAGARHLKINITEYAPGTEHKMHKHPGQEEVIYVLEGKGISRTENGDQPIGPGAFVFIPENTDHATLNVQKERPMKAIVIKGPP